MANAINTDSFLTNTATKGQKVDTGGPRRERDGPATHATRLQADRADIEHARRRLAQQVESEPSISGREQAQERLARLRAQLSADPRAALQAHGRADATLFEAATARPTA